MPKVQDITRESWILNTFPEWGSWLNEEIEEEVVPEGNFSMWWLGNCGVWIKTPGGANVVMDLYSSRGKSTKKVKDMVPGHQMANMAGVRKLQPNLRAQPVVLDPFLINELDYYLVSHFHSDHICINTAAAILNNPKLDHVKFIGPYEVGETWKRWGVPEERMIIVKPGDSLEFKDMKITALESFDRTCIVTLPVKGADAQNGSLKGLPVTDEEMNSKAVNYVFEMPGGTVYHGFDSHFSNYTAKHGRDFNIDVTINNYGENPIGIQDKMTSIDLLRMAENLRCKVVIPVHHDIWTNFQASTDEILALWNMRKERLQYGFHPFIWQVGGKYTYPQDKNRLEYHHPRGFDDCFLEDSNIQFKALL
ncbi:L-ascorbate 6-phosphate lactonase [Streptococcus zalophi]|uniref:L-ascorbate 6-phosphate lactonase n=1 Tax=Streptococcus zalophi TaxID=640031 RepID=A0A934UDP1_9STRE|nr:L-ascorbate 6-phosphate lactonase [Streptococcus zalophi]MBJ8350027.1 L-ascorbate 6-phosphate lactonase [Streptococcus zalophi]MCR8967033.1 L-ascorbate 6-phosphate lactonase [Streptococcus zalophi]